MLKCKLKFDVSPVVEGLFVVDDCDVPVVVVVVVVVPVVAVFVVSLSESVS